jgi:hypothetical protein
LPAVAAEEEDEGRGPVRYQDEVVGARWIDESGRRRWIERDESGKK